MINIDKSDGVFTIELDNQARRNALSLEMLAGIKDALNDAGQSDARVIVISAKGPVFCPGHDLKEMSAARGSADGGKSFFAKTMALCSDVMQAVVMHALPVVAKVDGVATAAGCQLVASCDLAVASDTSTFATPGVHIGLFCSTPMVALSRNVARKHAMEMLLTGTPVSADRAVDLGLINRSVPAAELGQSLAEFTDAITSKSSMTLKIGKRAFYEQSEMSLGQAYEHCAAVMVENMMNKDAEEGINAFIEKRDPQWTDS